MIVSEVGFEPTPSFEDQNSHFIEVKSISLESGALDRSAILTWLLFDQFSYNKFQLNWYYGLRFLVNISDTYFYVHNYKVKSLNRK